MNEWEVKWSESLFTAAENQKVDVGPCNQIQTVFKIRTGNQKGTIKL